MAEVVEIERIEELDGCDLLWRSLLARTRRGSFFQSLDWLRAYWRRYGAGQKLRVLIVSSGGRPIGLLPLTLLREKTRVGPVRVLTYPLHDWGSFYGPIGPYPAATLMAGLRHLAKTRRDWDLLDLRWTDKDGCDHGRTATAMELAGLAPRQRVWKELAAVDMEGSWEEYLASRPAKFRANLGRQVRRAERRGRLEHIRYRPLGASYGEEDPRWDLYDAAVELARRSWQGRSATGTTLSHASVSRFFRETHALAAKAGALDLNLLTLHGRPIAFGYNYHADGYVVGLRVGYDPEFASLGPGNILYARMIQDGFERGDQTLDLGPESMPCKRPWLTRVAASYRCTHYRGTDPRAQLLRMKHWLRDRTAAWAENGFRRCGTSSAPRTPHCAP